VKREKRTYVLLGAAADSAVGVSEGVEKTEAMVTTPRLLVAVTGFTVVVERMGVTTGTDVVMVGVEVVGTTTVTISVDAARVGTGMTADVVTTGGGGAAVVTAGGGAADV
jgi:hypothetical protein